jgi:hypothetical protein
MTPNTFKPGDMVSPIHSRISLGMGGFALYADRTYTVEKIENNTIKLSQWPNHWFPITDFYKIEELKPGMYFKKDADIFIFSESVNKSWLVNVQNGECRWLTAKGNYISTDSIIKLGYERFEFPKEVFTVIAKVNG